MLKPDDSERSLRFTPSKVEGMDNVAEVVVHPDRLQILSAGAWGTIPFVEIARPHITYPPGKKTPITHTPKVADGDWCAPKGSQFYAFYTTPPLLIYMPLDSPDEYSGSEFDRIRRIIRSGGFETGVAMDKYDIPLRFVPPRVEGLPDVTEVVVHRDKLEVLSAGKWLTYPFADMARLVKGKWERMHLFWRKNADYWIVGDKARFETEADNFFRFYTPPPLTLHFPLAAGGDSRLGHFQKSENILRGGGFHLNNVSPKQDLSSLCFTPSRVEGMADVTEVIAYPDRLELLSAGEWVTVRFEDIAQWPRPVKLRKWLFQRHIGHHFVPIGERDWFQAKADKFFAFYTEPKLVIYMPFDNPEGQFGRFRNVIHSGGYTTYDMG